MRNLLVIMTTLAMLINSVLTHWFFNKAYWNPEYTVEIHTIGGIVPFILGTAMFSILAAMGTTNAIKNYLEHNGKNLRNGLRAMVMGIGIANTLVTMLLLCGIAITLNIMKPGTTHWVNDISPLGEQHLEYALVYITTIPAIYLMIYNLHTLKRKQHVTRTIP